jgi:hypothetical protein
MRARLLIPVLFCLSLSGCLSEDERQAVESYLTCDDCLALEREVVSIGWEAIAPLAAALVGPGAADTMNVRTQLHLDYSVIEATASMSETEYVDLGVSNFRARVRTQAASGLGSIARACTWPWCRDRAQSLLMEAVRTDSVMRFSTGALYRDDVLRVIVRQAALPLPVYLTPTP